MGGSLGPPQMCRGVPVPTHAQLKEKLRSTHELKLGPQWPREILFEICEALC